MAERRYSVRFSDMKRQCSGFDVLHPYLTEEEGGTASSPGDGCPWVVGLTHYCAHSRTSRNHSRPESWKVTDHGGIHSL
jgi:hypothetical protein